MRPEALSSESRPAGPAADLHTQDRKKFCPSGWARQQRRRGRGELAALEHVVHAGKAQRLGLVDGNDARGRIRTGHQRHVPRARHGDVGGEAAFSHHEAPVFAHAAIG